MLLDAYETAQYNEASRKMYNPNESLYSVAAAEEEHIKIVKSKTTIKNLVDAGLIESKNRGLPAKRCFRIIEDIELISTLISQGEKNQLSIKPAAVQSYEKKRKNRIDAQQPCSAETTEQE